MKRLIVLTLGVVLSEPSCLAARKALVIGNGTYTEPQMTVLTTPINDAEDIAARLSTMQFAVDAKIDLKQQPFRDAITDFVASLREGDTALFYYAGHAIQVNGQNFLWPVDLGLVGDDVIEDEFIPIQMLYDGLRAAKTTINIVVLEACRNNPFIAEGFIPGLALPRATPDSSFIAYATKENSLALAIDVGSGPRKHSPYTHALLSQMGRTGVPIAQIFADVRNIVASATGQIPVVENTLSEVFYFRPPVSLVTHLSGVDDDAIVLLDGVEQFSARSGITSRAIQLHGGDNHFTVKVFNQRSFTGGIEFLGGRKPEGWHYSATFTHNGRELVSLSAAEDEPDKDGPRHGELFTAATFNVNVDDESGSVGLAEGTLDRDAWQRAGMDVELAPPAVLTDSIRKDLQWAATNSGSAGCSEQYLPHLDCVFVGQRACLMHRAAQLSRQGNPSEAFRLVLVTQCHNPGAQTAMRRAGSDVINSWLRQLE